MPPGFRFSLKVPKIITHEQGLIGSAAAWRRFQTVLEPLGDQRGPLLFQFPYLAKGADPEEFETGADFRERLAAFLPLLPDPPHGPLSFLSDDLLDHYAATFERTGMTGAFNRYRALAFDAATVGDLAGATDDQPACFIAGSRDPVRGMLPGVDSYAEPGGGCTDFRSATIIEGAGHWVHQEAPDEVNAALDTFLDSLDP